MPVSGGLGFGIEVSGICVSGFEFLDPGLGLMVQCLRLKVLGLGTDDRIYLARKTETDTQPSMCLAE